MPSAGLSSEPAKALAQSVRCALGPSAGLGERTDGKMPAGSAMALGSRELSLFAAGAVRLGTAMTADAVIVA